MKEADAGSAPPVFIPRTRAFVLPVPDLVVVVHQAGYISSLNHLNTADAVGFIDPALLKVVADSEDRDSFFLKLINVVIGSRGMVDPHTCDLQWLAFLRHKIVN